MTSPCSSSVSSAALFSWRTAVIVHAINSGDASSRRTCPSTSPSTSLAAIERTLGDGQDVGDHASPPFSAIVIRIFPQSEGSAHRVHLTKN
jgi:hypothetical protein